jgi:hypothetical protein
MGRHFESKTPRAEANAIFREVGKTFRETAGGDADFISWCTGDTIREIFETGSYHEANGRDIESFWQHCRDASVMPIAYSPSIVP